MLEELTADQIEACKLIKDWFLHSTRQTFVLAGYAGTGKTTLLKHTVCEVLGLDAEKHAAFVTPTGKAATVLIKNGIPATTVHKLIYRSILEETEVSLNGKKVTVEKLRFTRRESIDKSIKLIVLDEASMVSDELLLDLAGFGVKLLICGDNAQLPPVEGLNGFLTAPDYTLKTIVRHERDNPVIMLSQAAREGRPLPLGKFGDSALVVDRRTFTGERRQNYLMKADQIICGTNSTRAQINEEVRRLIGFEGMPKSGEKLICIQNNWEKFIDAEKRFNLINGIIGTVVDPFYDLKDHIGFMQFLPDFTNELCPEVVRFDTGNFEDGNFRYKRGDYFPKFNNKGEIVGAETLNRFEYGYCISCHKAQGSEFNGVVVFDESFCFKEDKHRWLYTAITRAKKRLVIVR
ncbi:MAG: AAA family ATPase [Clostridia bacterium]|nr:AAA family ATPase [Clostridia bacterium]